MEKLNLPIIIKPLPKQKALSMNEYLEFVEFHLKHTFNRKAYNEEKKKLSVNVPFSIK
ncbi:MAG: hypothetical protein PHX78_11410 [bacterium]|nr:hypothetical protein [bacterium]